MADYFQHWLDLGAKLQGQGASCRASTASTGSARAPTASSSGRATARTCACWSGCSGRIEGQAGRAPTMPSACQPALRRPALGRPGLHAASSSQSVIGIDKAAWQQELSCTPNCSSSWRTTCRPNCRRPRRASRPRRLTLQAAPGRPNLQAAYEAAAAVRPPPRDRGLRPRARPGAELLVLAGDIDATWAGLARFAGWPVPVLFVPATTNSTAATCDQVVPALRAHCAGAGHPLLQRESCGRRPAPTASGCASSASCAGAISTSSARPSASAHARRRLLHALMAATRVGAPSTPRRAHRGPGLPRLAGGRTAAQPAQGRWDRTVVVTHFAPSLRSADPRYGRQPGTASFCNADDDLIPRPTCGCTATCTAGTTTRVTRPGRAPTRVVCQARGLVRQGRGRGLRPAARDRGLLPGA
jgi:hypothetical protein